MIGFEVSETPCGAFFCYFVLWEIKMINRMVSYMITKNYIQDNMKEEYIYAAQMLIEKVYTYIMVMLVGLLSGKCIQTIIFAVTWCCLRKNTGGYHACSTLRCFVGSAIMLLLVVAFAEKSDEAVLFMNILLVLSSVYIFIVGTVNNPYIDYDENELAITKERTRKKIIAVVLIIVLLSFLSVPMKNLIYVYWGIVLCALSMMLERIRRKIIVN